MIQIYPVIEDCISYLDFPFQVEEIVFSGMRVFAKIHSEKDELYWVDLPVAHGLFYPFYFEDKQRVAYPSDEKNWYYKALNKTIETLDSSFTFPIEIRHSKLSDELLVLNTIDIYYGHVLLKLLSLTHYLENEKGKDFLVIVPKFLSWFVPKSCNAIIVDIPLRSGANHISNLDVPVKRIVDQYSKVFLSKAYSAPHPKDVKLDLHTSVVPASVASLLENTLVNKVAFIWREDRTILAGTFIENAAMSIKNRFRINFPMKILVLYQKLYVNRLFKKMSRKIDNLEFHVIGFGSANFFSKGIIKNLVQKPSASQDLEWNSLYSQMKLVIGVHGSNMLFPSGYSPMTLEILPSDRLYNYLQDITLNSPADCRDILHRYRFLPTRTRIGYVSKVAIAMISNYKQFHKEMMEDVYWKND